MFRVGRKRELVPAHGALEAVTHEFGKRSGCQGRSDGHLFGNRVIDHRRALERPAVDFRGGNLQGMHEVRLGPELVGAEIPAFFACHPGIP